MWVASGIIYAKNEYGFIGKVYARNEKEAKQRAQILFHKIGRVFLVRPY